MGPTELAAEHSEVAAGFLGEPTFTPSVYGLCSLNAR